MNSSSIVFFYNTIYFGIFIIKKDCDLEVIIFYFRTVCVLSICMLLGQTMSIADDEPNTFSRLKIGLVLSGGGARGAAHVGVLKVLEENHIPVDVIAGTSFGSIVGGLYATGYSADELEEILRNIKWQEVLSSKAPRNQRSFRRKQDDQGFLIKFKVGVKNGKLKLPSGLVSSNNLRLALRDLINNMADVNNFDNLAVPFRAVATDLETGLEVIIGKGDLTSAMVASMAVPALFPPVEHGDKLLVDGGVSNNIPVNVARMMGADIVIVVDISAPLKSKDEISSFASVLDQLMTIMTKKAAREQLATLTDQDILIRPDLGDISFVDFERTLEALPRGVKAARKMISQLQKIALSKDDWQAHLDARHREKQNQPPIDFIRIVNNSSVSDKIISTRLSQKQGQPFDADAMSKDLTEIYGLELFEEVNYSLAEENGQFGVEIQAKQPQNGEDHIRFGMALQGDFEGETGFQLAAGYTNLALNSRGGEWKALFKVGDEFGLSTEFYQPVDFAERYYVFANTTGRKINRNIIDSSSKILSQVRISEVLLQTGVGRNFGEWGTLRAGLQRSFGNIRGRIGFPEDLKLSFDQTTLVAGFEIDTLDNIAFPHSGITLDFVYQNNLPWLSGNGRIDNILVSGYKPFSWGQNTIGLNFQFGTSFGGTPDETDLFPLGGFLSLTAYSPGQLTGNHGGSVGAIFYRRVAGGPGYLAQTPLYIGGLLEAGNVWNRSSEMRLDDLRWSSSVFVGADTLIGPIYLGFALGDGGQTSAFLFVGQLF